MIVVLTYIKLDTTTGDSLINIIIGKTDNGVYYCNVNKSKYSYRQELACRTVAEKDRKMNRYPHSSRMSGDCRRGRGEYLVVFASVQLDYHTGVHYSLYRTIKVAVEVIVAMVTLRRCCGS